jgi:hypothetical protein
MFSLAHHALGVSAAIDDDDDDNNNNNNNNMQKNEGNRKC